VQLRALAVLSIACSSALAVSAACTGDDPNLVATAPDASDLRDASTADGDPPADSAPPDAGPPSCFRAEFATVAPDPVLSSDAGEFSITFSGDEQTVYVASQTGGNGFDIMTATREAGAAFPSPSPHPVLNSAADDFGVAINGGHTQLIFSSSRNASQKTELFGVTRATSAPTFTAMPTVLADLSSPENDSLPFLAAGEIYFSRGAGGVFTIMRAQQTGSTTFSTPTEVAELAKAGTGNLGVVVSVDGRTIYFGSDRGGTLDIWTATRPSDSGPFSEPVKVAGPDLNTLSIERPAWLSADGCRLYFLSDRDRAPNVTSVWLATRTPR
jgi:hypothetical protein